MKMGKGEIGKIRALVAQITTCLDKYEGADEGEEMAEDDEMDKDGTAVAAKSDDDDMPLKSMEMKLRKYV